MSAPQETPAVAWHDGAPGDDEVDTLLRRHVLAVLGPGVVTVGRLCPGCGSDLHGRPWATHARDRRAGVGAGNGSGTGIRHTRPREVWVSLARAGGYVVTAVSLRGPVGVDAEVVQDVAHGWSDAVVLADGESVDGSLGGWVDGWVDASADGDADTGTERDDRARARCWAAKEAVLKRRGTGLATPMTHVRLAEEPGLTDLPAPPGLVAVLAAPH